MKKIASLVCLLLSTFNTQSVRVVSIIFDGKSESYDDGQWRGTCMTIPTRIFWTLTVDEILNRFREHFSLHSREQLTLFFKNKLLTGKSLGDAVTEDKYSEEIFVGNGKSPFHVTIGKTQISQCAGFEEKYNMKVFECKLQNVGNTIPSNYEQDGPEIELIKACKIFHVNEQ